MNRGASSGEAGVWIGIAAYFSFAAAKIAGGWVYGSSALVADGLNNASDLCASAAVLVGLRLGRKPPDRNHPYGHRRAETVASLLASFLMATVGLQLVGSVARRLLAGDHPQAPDRAAAVWALVAAVVMFSVYLYNRRLARRLHSHALAAVAADNRSDALVSLGTAVGILGARAGWPWLDPAAAAVVGIIILRMAWKVFSASAMVLTDGFDEQQLAVFKETAEKTEGVLSVRQMRARAYGSHVCLEITVLVDPRLTVEQSHGIAERLEERLKRKHRVLDVHVHVEPGPASQPQNGRTSR